MGVTRYKHKFYSFRIRYFLGGGKISAIQVPVLPQTVNLKVNQRSVQRFTMVITMIAIGPFLM